MDHAKKFPPTPDHTASPVLSRYCSQAFDLAQVCHRNKICPKLVSTWKLTLELAFPAHCILNYKLNGISRTNVTKVALNAANEHPLPLWCATDPLLGQEVGEKCAMEHESVVRNVPSGWSPYVWSCARTIGRPAQGCDCCKYLRGCVIHDELWPWLISFRSFCYNFAIKLLYMALLAVSALQHVQFWMKLSLFGTKDH